MVGKDERAKIDEGPILVAGAREAVLYRVDCLRYRIWFQAGCVLDITLHTTDDLLCMGEHECSRTLETVLHMTDDLLCRAECSYALDPAA